MAYTTSSDYQTAISNTYRNTFITGELVTNTGQAINIQNEDISGGSLYITNQCVNGDAFEYGSVFTAEMGVTLKTEIDRYSLFDSQITLNFNIQTESGIETIPLGEFFVSEPSRVGNNVTIKAYDGMMKLDKDVDENTIGTPFELLNVIATKCDVELAQTEAEIKAFTNGNKTLSVIVDRVGTYRDLLAYISMVVCGFAIFDREGKLKIVEMGQRTDKVIQAEIRSMSKFSDFESYHTRVQANFVLDSVYKVYGSMSQIDDGLLYDLGDVPVVQGLDSENQLVLDNIMEKLEPLRYTPCEFTFNGDPAIDLGDIITCVDRQGNNISTLVTFYKWTYRGRHQIKSAGANPKLTSVKEKKNKDLANLEAEISEKDFIIHPYTNARELVLKKGNYEDLLKIAFAVSKSTTTLFICTIHCNFDCDGFLELSTYIDNVHKDDSDVVHYCSKGDNTITFFNYFVCEANRRYRITVKGRACYGESDLRINQAEIETQKNATEAIVQAYTSIYTALKDNTTLPINIAESISYDEAKVSTTVPTATIEPFHLKASIFGQGMAGSVKWDGTLSFEENALVKFESIDVLNTLQTVGIEKRIPERAIASDVVTLVELSGLSVLPIEESITSKIEVKTYYFETSKANSYSYDKKYVSDDGSFKLITEYNDESELLEIDSGTLSEISFDFTKFSEVSQVKVEVI